MSKLSANDAKLDSRSVDNIFWSPFLLFNKSVPFWLDGLLEFDVGFRIDPFLFGCNTSPKASNSIENISN